MSSYTKYKYNNRTQNTGKMKNKLKATVKNIKKTKLKNKTTEAPKCHGEKNITSAH